MSLSKSSPPQLDPQNSRQARGPANGPRQWLLNKYLRRGLRLALLGDRETCAMEAPELAELLGAEIDRLVELQRQRAARAKRQGKCDVQKLYAAAAGFFVTRGDSRAPTATMRRQTTALFAGPENE
jgi:hypothetical protein